MKASKIEHMGENRIKIDFLFNNEIASKLKQIQDARWSKTLNAWHIPYTKEAFEQLKSIFPNIEIPPVVLPKPLLIAKTTVTEKPNSDYIENTISIEYTTKRIVLKMKKNDTDIQFVRTFQYVRWDKVNYCWVIPNYGNNLELFKNYFSGRIAKIEFKAETPKQIIPVVIHPPYESELPELDTQSLKEIASFKQWMEHKRYSESTIKTYIQAISIFLKFIKPKASAEATNDDMILFVHQYLIPRKLSLSYQNQAVHPVGF